MQIGRGGLAPLNKLTANFKSPQDIGSREDGETGSIPGESPIGGLGWMVSTPSFLSPLRISEAEQVVQPSTCNPRCRVPHKGNTQPNRPSKLCGSGQRF